MIDSQHRRAIGTFTCRQDAEHALDELNSAGLPIAQVLLIAKDAECDDLLSDVGISACVQDITQERTATCATITGGLLGAIGGCLMGLGLLSVPGVGLAVAVGTSGAALVTTLAGAGIGAASCSLIEALSGCGIFEERTKVELERFSHYEYLVMVDGTDDEVYQAESILMQLYPTKVEIC